MVCFRSVRKVEFDILACQEKNRINYLEGFQALAERSYDCIEKFDTV